MNWRDAIRPLRMQRIAIVAPRRRLRETLVALAGCGLVELDLQPLSERSEAEGSQPIAHVPAASGSFRVSPSGPETAGVATAVPEAIGLEAARMGAETLQLAARAVPRVLAEAPGIAELEQDGRWDAIAGEVELRRVAAHALTDRGAAILIGWTPRARLAELSHRLAAAGASVVGLPHPARWPAPTLISGTRVGRPFRPLVDTYGVVPYANVDPTLFAAATYVLMFGMMFGDVGHGLILAGLGLWLRRTSRPALGSLRPVWPVIVAAGLTAAMFGVLYGEVFGPTGILPPIWLAPSEQPIAFLVAGVLVGTVLLSVAYLIGIVNRWREGGSARALYAGSGIAGACLFFGGGTAVAGLLLSIDALLGVGLAMAGLGTALMFIGFLTEAGGGLGGATEAVVELVDAVVRIASNTVSFARLAAFGLTHAAIGAVVWAATVALAASGGFWLIAAVAVFIVGNALAFGLEALVAAVQALRLEYYELFSRIFSAEGRVFRPWQLSVASKEEA